MKICITIDDILREKTKEIVKVYKKNFKHDLDPETVDISTNDLCKVLGFPSEKEYQKFLYEDYPFEIFGKALTPEVGFGAKFNNWTLWSQDEDFTKIDDDIEFMLANPMEFNLSIGCTYFFLSKLATRIREVYLPTDSLTIWDKCDVLITADKKLLANKPEGKIAVKIETEYNKDEKADFTYNTMLKLIEDEEFFKRLKAI